MGEGRGKVTIHAQNNVSDGDAGALGGAARVDDAEDVLVVQVRQVEAEAQRAAALEHRRPPLACKT